MSDYKWKKVRTFEHSAFPEMSFHLEVNENTLGFRMKIQGQTFTGKDGNEVIKQAGDYLRDLSVPGNWQPIIELALFSWEVKARRLYIRVEENGAIVQHPWLQDPGEEIKFARITQLEYHKYMSEADHRKKLPCMHGSGFSRYVHLPYTQDVWEHIQALELTFNTSFATLDSFLKAVTTHQSSTEWEAHFLDLWKQLSFFAPVLTDRGGTE